MGIVERLGKGQLNEIASSMKWRIRADSWDTFPVGQKWFALGECLAHLDHLVVTGRLRRHEDEIIRYEIL